MEDGWYFARRCPEHRRKTPVECVEVQSNIVYRTSIEYGYSLEDFIFLGRIHIPPEVEGK